MRSYHVREDNNTAKWTIKGIIILQLKNPQAISWLYIEPKDFEKKIVPDQENQRKEYLRENAIVEIHSPSLELAKQSA